MYTIYFYLKSFNKNYFKTTFYIRFILRNDYLGFRNLVEN